MSFDYGPITAKAHAAITKYGREVKLVGLDLDTHPTKDWRAEATPTERFLPVKAVFFPPSQGVKLGMATEIQDLAKRCSSFALLATSADLDTYHALLDGTDRYQIEGMEKLQPGKDIILWMVGLKQ